MEVWRRKIRAEMVRWVISLFRAWRWMYIVDGIWRIEYREVMGAKVGGASVAATPPDSVMRLWSSLKGIVLHSKAVAACFDGG